MNIFMSADWFYPSQMGGPSNAIYWQAKAMTRAGHNVTVVAISQDLPAEVPTDHWLDLDCGRVIYTRNPHFYLPFKHIWHAIRVIWRTDVVHINSLFYPSSIVLVIAAQVFRKRIIWAPHGELSPQALIYRPRLKRSLLHLFRAVSWNVVFHSTATAETVYIRQHFGSRVAIREMGNMMELPARVERRAKKYLLFIGRLHPIKAIDRLLEALGQSILFRNSAYTLVIAGSVANEAYAAYLTQLTGTLTLTDKVTFMGPVHGNQKEQLYADAHLTILPSQSENFGNVVVESLVQGTPVVASTGTPWQLLRDRQIGDWVENDPLSLQLAIERYLQMPPDTYQSQRQRAAQIARTTFDIMANIDQWQRFYEETAA